MDVNKLPSFKDVAIKRFEHFHKEMEQYDTAVDLSYDEWCDLWINSGYIEDIDDYIMLPTEPCRSVGYDNIIILHKDDAGALHGALLGFPVGAYEPFEPEVEYCEPTDSVVPWDEYEDGESPY